MGIISSIMKFLEPPYLVVPDLEWNGRVTPAKVVRETYVVRETLGDIAKKMHEHSFRKVMRIREDHVKQVQMLQQDYQQRLMDLERNTQMSIHSETERN